jgi:hypothetical protein
MRCGVNVVCCVVSLLTLSLTQQPARITKSYAYRHIAHNKEKSFMLFLVTVVGFIYWKTTNVNEISYLGLIM